MLNTIFVSGKTVNIYTYNFRKNSGTASTIRSTLKLIRDIHIVKVQVSHSFYDSYTTTFSSLFRRINTLFEHIFYTLSTPPTITNSKKKFN